MTDINMLMIMKTMVQYMNQKIVFYVIHIFIKNGGLKLQNNINFVLFCFKELNFTIHFQQHILQI